MSRSPQLRAGFTLIEMIVVMAVIAILAGLILSINGLVQSKAARAKAQTEIKAMSAGCENYKADNGGYPQTTETDKVNARTDGNPTSYQKASKNLYIALSGDTDANGTTLNTEGKNYAPDFFKPERLGGTKNSYGLMTSVTYIMDPFGNSYGYSTIGAAEEQDFAAKLRTNPQATRTTAKGYSPNFDLWSTAGKTSAPTPGNTPDVTTVWEKNW